MNVGEMPLAAKLDINLYGFSRRMHILFYQRESKETQVTTYESLGASQTRGLALDLEPCYMYLFSDLIYGLQCSS